MRGSICPVHWIVVLVVFVFVFVAWIAVGVGERVNEPRLRLPVVCSGVLRGWSWWRVPVPSMVGVLT